LFPDKERIKSGQSGFAARAAKAKATIWYNENINRFNRARGAAYNGKGASGVGVSRTLGRDPAKFAESLANDVKTGWIPAARATIKGTADHEFGHMLAGLLGLRYDSDLKKIWDWSKTEVKWEVSDNGKQNIDEFVADAWAEYRNGKPPRAAAMAVGHIVEKRYVSKFLLR